MNNFFEIKDLNQVVIIGACPNIDEILNINSKLKIKTLIVTSPNQKNQFDKKIKINIFKALDNKFENFINQNCQINRTLFLSVSSMFVFKKKQIKFFKNNLINYFPSRLPYDAGRGGFSWHIMREDRILNNTFHIIDEGINTGPIIFEDTKIFPNHCKIPIEYENFKWSEMNVFYGTFLKQIISKKKFLITKQNNSTARYNPSLNTLKNGFIDWNINSYDLYNFINAFDDPFLGASTFLNQKGFGRLFIKKVHLHGGDTGNHPFFSGIISRHDNNWITVSTAGKHMLLIEEVLNLKGENILKKLKAGDRFVTPLKYIEESKHNQAIYRA